MERSSISVRTETLTRRLIDKYARENHLNRSDVIREALVNFFSCKGWI